MKKNKGFTLIELLTVIAILAIILLIAAPTILGVLDKARKNTFKNQVLLYVEALKTEVALSATGNSDMNLALPDEGKTIEVDITTIPMDTNPGYKGTIIITNKGNNKYTYTLSGISSDDYKITEDVEATKLEVSKIAKADEKVEEPEEPVTYLAYNIGDAVTLKDGTTWYVIENSEETSDTVTLFASKNFKKDGTGWSEQTTETSDYAIAFDEANARTTENNTYCTNPEYGCNIYAANGTTVMEDSTIKKFLDGSVLNYINTSLTTAGGTSIGSIRLIKNNEICNIINSFDSNNNCLIKTNEEINVDIVSTYLNIPQWLGNTYYWTMSAYENNSNGVYYVGNNVWYFNENNYANSADHPYGFINGARPVIVTLKSNIK